MGLFSNMFNLKSKYVDEPDDRADLAPKETMKTFYLDPDSAKTIGKKAKPAPDSSAEDKVVVKDTAIEEVAPVIEEKATVDKQVTPPEPETTSSEPSESSSQDAGPTDDGMDMFRNMARKMKKR